MDINKGIILQDLKNTFYEIMNLHYIVTHEMAGTKPSKKKYWKGVEQILSAKLVNHLFTIIHLSEGTPIVFGKNHHSVIDKSLIATILRAALETYLTFHHIYVSTIKISTKKKINEIKLRYLSWLLSDLYFSQYFVSKDRIKKKVFERKQIIEALEQIDLYKSLSDKKKKLILKGNWRLEKPWSDLAIDAGFTNNSFIKIYKFLCSHSHTGSHSINQLKMEFDFEEEKEKTTTPIGISILILCKFISDYCILHQKARIKLYRDILGKKMLDDNLKIFESVYFTS